MAGTHEPQVIAAVQSKGGVGKSVIVCALAYHLARDGARVAIVDTDPQQDCAAWIEACEAGVDGAGGVDPGVDVFECQQEDVLVDVVDHLATDYDTILIDTAGYQSAITIYAVQVADLVLVPMSTSMPDTRGAVRVWQHVLATAKAARRKVDIAIVLNQANPRANITATMRDALSEAGAPVLGRSLPRLVGFQEMMTHGGVPSGAAASAFSSVVGAMQMDGLLGYYRRERVDA